MTLCWELVVVWLFSWEFFFFFSHPKSCGTCCSVKIHGYSIILYCQGVMILDVKWVNKFSNAWGVVAFGIWSCFVLTRWIMNIYLHLTSWRANIQSMTILFFVKWHRLSSWTMIFYRLQIPMLDSWLPIKIVISMEVKMQWLLNWGIHCCLIITSQGKLSGLSKDPGGPMLYHFAQMSRKFNVS